GGSWPDDVFAFRIARLTFQGGWIISCRLPRFSGRADDAIIIQEIASQAILSVALTLHRERETRWIHGFGSKIIKDVVLYLQECPIVLDAGDLKTIRRPNRFRIER